MCDSLLTLSGAQPISELHSVGYNAARLVWYINQLLVIFAKFLKMCELSSHSLIRYAPVFKRKKDEILQNWIH